MTFSLTITADTFDAFKAKIIALEDMFAVETVAADPVMPEVKEAAKKAAPATKKAEEPKPEPEAEKVAEPKAEEPKAEEPKAETLAGVPDKSDKAAFDAFVAEQIIPRVTRIVAKKGKPFMLEILGNFNAAKATEVPTEQIPALIEQMDEALAS